MSTGRSTTARVTAAAVLLSLSAVPLSATVARGDTASEAKARMEAIQADLDSATARLEELRHEQDELLRRVSGIEAQIADVQARRQKLQGKVIKRAQELYRSGSTDVLEVLFSSSDFSELTARTEILSQVSLRNTTAFVDMARTTAEMEKLSSELATAEEDLDGTADAMAQESEALQARLADASAAYRKLQAAQGVQAPAPSSGGGGSTTFPVSGNITCPVAGPVSFIDSWGAPRSGHTHQGVDMMASYGTPVVAIVSGTITYSGYGGSAGYWQILSGDDGNAYWYMHNQSNLVNGGHVEVGRQIATVGDTGNAAGTPHLHFEFHPGGGSAVNPYPLVASVC